MKISLRSLKPWKHKEIFFDLWVTWSFLTASRKSVAWSIGSMHFCVNISKHCMKDVLHLLLQSCYLSRSGFTQRGWSLLTASHRLTWPVHENSKLFFLIYLDNNILILIDYNASSFLDLYHEILDKIPDNFIYTSERI